MVSRTMIGLIAICLVAVIPAATAAGGGAKSLEVGWLISPEEAEKLAPGKPRGGPIFPTPKAEPEPLLTTLKTGGPILEVQKPSSSRIASPVDILILLRQRNAPVDIRTLRCDIKHRGGLLSKNITDAVLPHLTAEKIDWPKAKIPNGRFDLTIRLKDQKGGETVAVAKLDVD